MSQTPQSPAQAQSSKPVGLPVIIPNYNRLALLEQTLTSLFTHSHFPVYPIVVDNGSDQDVKNNLQELAERELFRYYSLPQQVGIGIARNFGAAVAPPSDYIYFSDNDVYFTKDWDKFLLDTLKHLPEVGILGGLRHPYHGVKYTLTCPVEGSRVTISDQQSGYSMLLKRDVWNRVGPFGLTGPHDYGQEDTEFCNRVKAAGYLLGALDPEVIVHCGITRADGTQTVGQELLVKEKVKYPQVLFE